MFIISRLFVNSIASIKTMSTLSSATSSETCVPSTSFSIAYVTISNQEEALQLAEKLVTQKLAACVNIIPKILSVYKWKGKFEKDEESLMMIKTKTSMVSQLIDFVRNNHSYEVCEVISVPIQQGNPPYLEWLNGCIGKETS